MVLFLRIFLFGIPVVLISLSTMVLASILNTYMLSRLVIFTSCSMYAFLLTLLIIYPLCQLSDFIQKWHFENKEVYGGAFARLRK